MAPRVFQGCIEGREIAMTRKGANPHTVKLVQKSAVKDPPAPAEPKKTPEKSKMSTKALQRIVAMNDVTKSYFIGLEEKAAETFLEKSEADQDAEAIAAADTAKRATEEAEAVKSGKTVRELELEKSLATQGTQIADLQKRLGEADIEKRATVEFAGFPGGTAAAVDLLKSFADLPEAPRKAAEDLMKRQIELAKNASVVAGLSPEEFETRAPASAQLAKKAEDVAKSKGIPIAEAQALVSEDPANATLFTQALAEERIH